VRRATPCTPPEAGQALYRHAREVALSEADALATIGGGHLASTRLAVGVNADSLATWFPLAMAQAAAGQQITFDIHVEDQDHSANLLREGRVMAAVTADPQPVQGCKVLPLGTLRYRALASPAFMQQHFAAGVTAATLALAPMLVFNRKDALQDRFVRRITRRKLSPPVHWLPEAHAFATATRAGLGWGMIPDPMVLTDLKAGTLVELLPGKPVDVPLYWQYWRLNVQALAHMTAAVQAQAQRALPAR
jgi:LysR family transcriptional regulator, chromosome initiation inhibitor